jgi:hypothetical protein
MKEEKIADGIYITKPTNSNSIPNQQTDTTASNLPEKRERKYVYRNTGELISILENEFEEIEKEVEMLYNANEEMLQYDPKDYDLIEARQENLVIINRKIMILKEIQDDLRLHCPTHPMVIRNVFDYFIKDKTQTDKIDEKKEISSNQQIIERGEEIIQELEL